MGKFLGFNQSGKAQVESDAGVARTVFDEDGALYQGGTKLTPTAAQMNGAAPAFTDPDITETITTHDYAAGTTAWTLSAAEAKKHLFKATNASDAVNMIVPATVRRYMVVNTSGQALTVKTAAGTGIAIASTKAAMVLCDGTNVIRLTPDA